MHTSLQSIAGQIGEVPFSVQCPDCNELVSLSSLSTSTSTSNPNLLFQHEGHNPRSNLPPPPSTAKDVCPHPQCFEIPFPHDSHCLVMQQSIDEEIMRRLSIPFAKNIRKPSCTEIRKYLRLAKGCSKESVSETWIKNMMNWDLYTHPRENTFALYYKYHIVHIQIFGQANKDLETDFCILMLVQSPSKALVQ
jgi:hypothetical protein